MDLKAGACALFDRIAGRARTLHISGRIVHHAAAIYAEMTKTDANDASSLADQARMRTGLQLVRGFDQISVDLRLWAALLEYFPAARGRVRLLQESPAHPSQWLPDHEKIRRIGLIRLTG